MEMAHALRSQLAVVGAVAAVISLLTRKKAAQEAVPDAASA